MRDNKSLIQSLPYNKLAILLNDFATDTYSNICKGNTSLGNDEKVKLIESWLHELEKPKEPNHVKLELEVSFYTDGDFYFSDINEIFDPVSSMYNGANVKYDLSTEFEYYNFLLIAEGPEDRCYYAARDLLESIMCHLQTSRYYIIRDVYQLLIPAKEQCLWSNKEYIDYSESIGGNYEGTSIILKIIRS